MAIVVRCANCEKDHEIPDKNVRQKFLECPHCGNCSASSDYSAVMFCPNCYAELQIPFDVLDRELECPYCDNVFRANIIGTLSADDDNDAKMFNESPDTMLSEGDEFDKYKIIRFLGRGGTGEVYLARHMLMNRDVAVKIMDASLAAGKPVYAKRFIMEAKVSTRIQSDNFVKIYDAGKESRSGALFIAMEYIDGCNLNQILQENSAFEEKDILHIALEICKVLQIFENNDIVHRDIKPSNIMIAVDGTIKLTDLGIAKAGNSDEDDVNLTQGNVIFGTPNYASPEQCRASHNVDNRSDIYSLGATMFHMAAGQPPYEASSAMDTVLKVLNEDPRDLEQMTSGFSNGFITLVKDMLKRNPDERPANAGILKKRIEELLSEKVRPDNYTIGIRKKETSVSPVNKARSATEKNAKKTPKKKKEKAVKKKKKSFPAKTVLKVIKRVVILLFILSGCYYGFKYRTYIFKLKDAAGGKIKHLKDGNIKEVVNFDRTEEDEEDDDDISPSDKKSGRKNASKKGRSRSDKAVLQRKNAEKQGAENIAAADGITFENDILRKTIEERLLKCEKKLKNLQEDRSNITDHRWYADQLKFYRRLQKNLKRQLKEREIAFNILYGKNNFNPEYSEAVRNMVREYSTLKEENPGRTKLLAQQLMHYLKYDSSDPNISVTDSSHPEFSGPLLRWLEHSNIPYKNEIEKVLINHHVSAACIDGDCSVELCKYGVSSMKGMLARAINERRFKDARVLIYHGADVNELDEEGRSALHLAVQYNNYGLVRLLLLAGADVNFSMYVTKETPLTYAYKYASEKIIKLLRSRGADVDKLDLNKNARVYEYVKDFNKALRLKDWNKVYLLLEKHKDLCDMLVYNGLTPLQFACKNENGELVLNLLKNGADPNKTSASCKYTPLQLVYDYTESKKISANERQNRWNIFDALLKKGAKASVAPVGGKCRTLLQFALNDFNSIDECRMKFITSLIENSDIKLELMSILPAMYRHNRYYYSADKHSSLRKRVFDMIISKKLDLDSEEFESLIPAVAWSPNISEADISVLLSRGARINGKDKKGRNVLYILCEYIEKNSVYIDFEASKTVAERIKFLMKNGADSGVFADGRNISDMNLPELFKKLIF